jgi:hypothetical protein
VEAEASALGSPLLLLVEASAPLLLLAGAASRMPSLHAREYLGGMRGSVRWVW